MRRLILIVSFWALTCARPETYREKEDFQYSRSSSDDGTKAGFYGAQRGNMGGNYERAHNMDSLAQHQMGSLVTQVDGELGSGADSKSGSVYTAGNSRGLFGSGHYDLSVLKGRNFAEGNSYGDSEAYSSASNSGYHGQSYSANNARYNGRQSQSSSQSLGYHAGQAGSYIDANNQEADYSQYSNLDQENRNQAARNYKFHSQASSQGSSQYEQSLVNSNSNRESNAQIRSMSATPLKVYVRPGTKVTIPISAQTYDASHLGASHADNTVGSDAEILVNSRPGVSYTPTNNAKHYESSYSYRKEWEKHDTLPLATPTENPFPKYSELYDSDGKLILQNSNRNTFDANSVQDSKFSNAYTSGYRGNSKLSTSRDSNYQTAYNAENINTATGIHSGASAVGAQVENSANANNLIEELSTKPKSYHSSYSYHKSWERQGDPYVIKPASGDLSGLSSQRLTSASENYGQHSSHQHGSHYNYARNDFSQSGTPDCDCDENGLIRVPRSYNDNDYKNYLRQQVENGWENQEDMGQQTQGQWDNFEDLGQQSVNKWEQLQDLDQQVQRVSDPQTQKMWENAEVDGPQAVNKHEKLEDLGQQSQSKWDDLEDLGQQTQNKWEDLEAGGQEGENKHEEVKDLGQQSENKWDDLEALDQHTVNTNEKLEDLGAQSDNKWDNFSNLGQQSQTDWNNIEAVGQQAERKNDELDDLGQQTQNKWDNLEALDQHTVNTNEKLENVEQQSRNKLKDTESVGQQAERNNEEIADLEQQSQNKWDNLEAVDQHTLNTNGKFENVGQETQNSWDNFMVIGQQAVNNKDKLEEVEQQSKWNNLETLNQQSQNKFDNIENIGQLTTNNWDNFEYLGQQTQNKKIFDTHSHQHTQSVVEQQSQNEKRITTETQNNVYSYNKQLLHQQDQDFNQYTLHQYQDMLNTLQNIRNTLQNQQKQYSWSSVDEATEENAEKNKKEYTNFWDQYDQENVDHQDGKSEIYNNKKDEENMPTFYKKDNVLKVDSPKNSQEKSPLDSLWGKIDQISGGSQELSSISSTTNHSKMYLTQYNNKNSRDPEHSTSKNDFFDLTQLSHAVQNNNNINNKNIPDSENFNKNTELDDSKNFYHQPINVGRGDIESEDAMVETSYDLNNNQALDKVDTSSLLKTEDHSIQTLQTTDIKRNDFVSSEMPTIQKEGRENIQKISNTLDIGKSSENIQQQNLEIDILDQQHQNLDTETFQDFDQLQQNAPRVQLVSINKSKPDFDPFAKEHVLQVQSGNEEQQLQNLWPETNIAEIDRTLNQARIRSDPVPKNHDEVAMPVEEVTEKPTFWKSVGNKLSNAKDSVVSWFKRS